MADTKCSYCGGAGAIVCDQGHYGHDCPYCTETEMKEEEQEMAEELKVGDVVTPSIQEWTSENDLTEGAHYTITNVDRGGIVFIDDVGVGRYRLREEYTKVGAGLLDDTPRRIDVHLPYVKKYTYTEFSVNHTLNLKEHPSGIIYLTYLDASGDMVNTTITKETMLGMTALFSAYEGQD